MDRCRVVLMETCYPGNLGATARVMRNMGLRELVLVNPQALLTDRQARQMATHGEDILDQARVVSDFGEAVANCPLVIGTTGPEGGTFRRQTVATPEAIMPKLAYVLRQGQPAALVFGSETNGLTNEIASRCHHLIHIPTSPEYTSLNVAQAVAICLYELRKAWLSAEPAAPPPTEALADFAAQELVLQHLKGALERIHFLYSPKSESLFHALRHLLGKARLTSMEVNVLHGLARQIDWYAENHP